MKKIFYSIRKCLAYPRPRSGSRNRALLDFLLAMGIVAYVLTGCGSGSAQKQAQTDTAKEVPRLPDTGRQLADFVPEGWEILDSVMLDFNEDGVSDYVGVLQETELYMTDYNINPADYPRILFAIAGDGAKGYRLDFQNSSLVYGRGGALTAEGTSFTVHTTYGSLLRWSPDDPASRGTHDDTYTFCDGNWRRTASVATYGYGDYITDYSEDDWENGVGIRKRRSSEFAEIEKNYRVEEYEDWESIKYDVVYELSLDEGPLTLEQIEKRSALSPYLVKDWEVKEIISAADVGLLEEKVKLPDEAEASSLYAWDENYVLYAFQNDTDTDKGGWYLAMYSRQDKVLSVLSRETSEIDRLELYKGKAYFTTELVENTTYSMIEDGTEQIAEEEAVVGVRLNRMDLDGTGKETIFEFRHQEAAQKNTKNKIPYLGLGYEISGDEIVAEIYIEGEPHPVYRMKTDGSGREQIGLIPSQSVSAKKADDTVKEVPRLPDTGRQLADFVPEGWEILDSVMLDFNEDGVSDYVGVLGVTPIDMEGYKMCPDYPKILFAVTGDKTAGYRLDFQDINLIRKGELYGEGNNWPLTAAGTSFTTHATGGKGWNWSEDYTYTYNEGIWQLTLSEETYGTGEYIGEYITSYSQNDWESGVGIRKKRGSISGDMEEEWDAEKYDLVYELSLDEPLTLEQAGKRSSRATEQVTDWEVKEIKFAADVELSEDAVRRPDEVYLDYCDENCVLYVFQDGQDMDRRIWYLAMYSWQDKILSVLEGEASEIASPQLYKGKIYFTTKLMENVTYKTIENGKEQITEAEGIVGVSLNRMDLDGAGEETIFEFRYQEPAEKNLENKIPYLALSYEISGDEIVAEVSIEGEPHPVYRIKTDGSGQEKIGQIE